MARIKKEKCYIDGKFVATSKHFPVHDPYNNEIIAHSPIADVKLLDKAMVSADRAFKPFASLKRYERAEMLHAISKGIAKRGEEFSQMIRREGGKPIALARGEVNRAQLTSKLAAEEATRFGGEWLALDIHPGGKDYTGLVGRVPLGPTLAISPFNFPLNLIMHKLAPAIAVGCPTIIKPSSDTPLTALMLAEVCHDAGLPPGTVQVVPCRGAAFEHLVFDNRPKMLSFTGSDTVGLKLNVIAGRKRVALELGGNAAVVVHEDADLKFAANRIAFGGYAHAGQICISVQRVFIHEPIHDTFLPILLKEIKKLKSGDPSDEKIIIGPMIRSDEVDRVQSWVKEAVDAGAKYLLKGRSKGNVLTPTVLTDAPPDSKVVAEEIFGPVMVIETYKTWDEAMNKVNDSRYGLQAGVFTKDVGRIMNAYEELEVGGIIANDIPTIRVDNYPYGGTKDSGQGREGIKCTMHEMTEERVLVMRL